ncbi:hypothetical protein TW85_21975 [Marinomonas sp. S3726]|uniref:phage tail tube protein n=1 Tax=Marinomonas sp. S3726 TaxID=579484 RepID=UPI0005FA67BA|nr:phage tail tube protein [Marinomonas sp. S3726]KJZ09426.1 hypothetical protein TW85_22015 [Marinomonas sp. S3726]KJZ09487.1 hypothetical protein TW85_21975 [Marinomonas sp. S3726]
MARVAKKLYFDIPGIGRVNSLPGASFNPGGQKRDAVMADLGPAGFSEEPVAPSCEYKIANTAGVDLNQLRNLTDVNVSIQDDNGQSWMISSAWMSEPPTLSGGEYSCKMEGISADPVS